MLYQNTKFWRKRKALGLTRVCFLKGNTYCLFYSDVLKKWPIISSQITSGDNFKKYQESTWLENSNNYIKV